MPFAALDAPSIGLTQIRAALTQHFCNDESVSVSDVLYVNQDFSRYLGLELYQFICRSAEAMNAGLGDWFFRQVAFPNLPDNSEIYYRRYFPMLTPELKQTQLEIEQKRQELETFLDQVVTKYSLDEANIVGFTSMFSQNVGCLALARKLKQRNEDVIVVIGGANCESPMGQEIIKHSPQIDYVFSGPALKSFPAFVQYCAAGERARCDQIKGVFTRDNVNNPPSIIGEEVDINSVVDLDYRSFLKTHKSNFPQGEVTPYLMFETSRGCWWGEKAHCTFCGLNGLTMAYRSMRPEKAIEHINSLIDNYSTECSSFECVDNIMPTNYPAEVFPHLTVTEGATIFYECKADLTAEEMQQMASASVKMIQPGIEALATSTLKLMKKGTTAFQNLAFLKNCLAYDLSPRWNLLVGFPGEEEAVYEKYLEDMPLFVHLPPPGAMAKVQFDRYSPYFNEAEKFGLKLQPSDYYSLTYPYNKESLWNLAYHFVDTNFKAEYIHTMIKWIVKVGELAARWQSLWKVPVEQRPQLYVKAQRDTMVVHDTRSGELIEHVLSPTRHWMLEQLHKPKRVSQLAKELPEGMTVDLAADMQWLKEQGLVFQEGDRFLSLPLPSEGAGLPIDYLPDIQKLVATEA
jgi:ribosomal peptide maturation radical SAM protein 1